MKIHSLHHVRRLLRLALGKAPVAMAGAVAIMGVAVAPNASLRPELTPMGEALALQRASDTQHALSELYDLAAQGRLDPLAPGLEGEEALRLNALSVDEAGVTAAPPFVLTPRSRDDQLRAIRCLTQAVYYEAALEEDAGQAGVAQVVLNRVRDPNYPNSICGVVYQGAERPTGCQFTFTCDGALSRPPMAKAWKRAEGVARKALEGAVAANVGAATHYHADYVRPWWAPSLTRVTQSGAHIFYRWKGDAGSVASLTQDYAGTEPLIDEARFAGARVNSDGPLETAIVVEDRADPLLSGNRRVEFEGTSRIVGAPSLGGRRQATAEEIAAINDRLKAFEEGSVLTP